MRVMKWGKWEREKVMSGKKELSEAADVDNNGRL